MHFIVEFLKTGKELLDSTASRKCAGDSKSEAMKLPKSGFLKQPQYHQTLICLLVRYRYQQQFLLARPTPYSTH